MTILQSALDKVNEVDEHRRSLLDTLLQLAINSGIVPKCLHVRGVNNVGQFPIASGGFGDVWRGEWEDRTVALKTVRAAILVSQNDDTIHRRLCKEVLLWRQLRHRHLLEFIGICNDVLQSPAIVSPWMQNGSVLQFVRLQPSAVKLRLLSEVADALQYLHNQSPAVIHQDIRCANILVNDSFEAVLSDFGLSRIDSTLLSVSTSSIEHGCLRWQAPELVFADMPRPCTATDIYALGMTGLELLTEKPPFASNATDPAVVMDLYHGRRPTRPTTTELPEGMEISDDIWRCLETCWSKDADARPSATYIWTCLMEEIEKLNAGNALLVKDFQTMQGKHIELEGALVGLSETLPEDNLLASSPTWQEDYANEYVPPGHTVDFSMADDVFPFNSNHVDSKPDDIQANINVISTSDQPNRTG
ncbi:kinase-like protein [Schizopora paradoxa]|uniref:Kinase-like protein n=1 Tax=Schizopora paradoxa TaxID=27342 RepID=A0A0H2S0B3_9AGAM|nr:kinase-like protein [Schizopora paradoxa]